MAKSKSTPKTTLEVWAVVGQTMRAEWVAEASSSRSSMLQRLKVYRRQFAQVRFVLKRFVADAEVPRG